MENNDSPYIYEKPLRSELRAQGVKRGKRLAKLSALGLVGMVGIFGGSAIASNVASATRASADADRSVNNALGTSDTEILDGDSVLTEAALDSAQSADSNSANAPVISVPFQEVKPKSNSVKIELPALPNQSFGNTSSATPSVGSSGSGGIGGGLSGNYSPRSDHGDRGERQSFENEYENEYEND